jgi:hypothetical protein
LIVRFAARKKQSMRLLHRHFSHLLQARASNGGRVLMSRGAGLFFQRLLNTSALLENAESSCQSGSAH